MTGLQTGKGENVTDTTTATANEEVKAAIDAHMRTAAARAVAEKAFREAERAQGIAVNDCGETAARLVLALAVSTGAGNGTIRYRGYFWQLKNGVIWRVKVGAVRDLGDRDEQATEDTEHTERETTAGGAPNGD